MIEANNCLMAKTINFNLGDFSFARTIAGKNNRFTDRIQQFQFIIYHSFRLLQDDLYSF